jgi:RNA polymerase sigma-70 factor (ECF subfamily)
MDFDTTVKQSRPVLAESGGGGSMSRPSFDPVRLELGGAGEDGDRLVFCKYQRRVQRFFEKKGVSPDQAKDLTQDTFMRVFRSEVRLDNREQLEAWLFEIARNVWINLLRTRATIKRAATVVSLDEPGLDGEAREIADPSPGAGEQGALTGVLAQEQLGILQSALSELPEQMRQCVRLRVKDDLKYREIAEIMKISIETVKSHLHQAKQRLRPKLEPHFGSLDF